MKKLTIVIAHLALLSSLSTLARAADFWETYSTGIMYHYSVKTGSIPDIPRTGLRLSNDEVTAILTKSFSRALGERLTDVADKKSYVAIVCIFHPEPERCFADNILDATFDEVYFINAPKFSQKFLKKMSKYYAYTINDDDEEMERRTDAAGRVPPWKKFNPRFSFDLNEPEIAVSAPFYSFAGIYVEPRYGTGRGPSMTFLFKRYLLDVQKEGVELKYRTEHNAYGRGYIAVSIRPEGEIIISNEFIIR